MSQLFAPDDVWPRSHPLLEEDSQPEGGADGLALAAPDTGYVYLSVSETMPGFVQLASSTEDPTGLTWTLQTFSGVTHFHNAYAAPTGDCRGLEERFRSAVAFDQIPHHADLFKLPLRFARQILEAEAISFPAPAHLQPKRSHSTGYTLAGGLALLLVLGAVLRPASHRADASATHRSRAIAKAAEALPAAPLPTPPKPRFRITKM